MSRRIETYKPLSPEACEALKEFVETGAAEHMPTDELSGFGMALSKLLNDCDAAINKKIRIILDLK